MKGLTKLAYVLDEVLHEAATAEAARTAQVEAIKVAAAAPRSALARGLRTLAHQVRTAGADEITYGDLS